ncbi:MAG: 50S ribosomal protein L6 [bacterium]|nr:50S ribosomal protein L6 [bacterium]
MSKVGKKPIIIPDGVSVKMEGGFLEIKGKEGSLSLPILPHTKIELSDKELSVKIENDELQARANWGTMRALAQNAITGVNSGFLKELEIQGVGYRASMEGNTLVLHVGFSHPVKILVPDGIKVSVEKNFIKISGFNKNLVGQVAAKIRDVKKPEPYQGKGIRYKGEVVRRKAGKKVASAAAAA